MGGEQEDSGMVSRNGLFFIYNKTNHPLPSMLHAFSYFYVDGPDDSAVTINASNTKSIDEGSPCQIVCTCGECHPSCSAAWKYKEGLVGLKGTLKFDDISRKQAGKYIYLCFNNATNKRVEKEFMLNVQCEYAFVFMI